MYIFNYDSSGIFFIPIFFLITPYLGVHGLFLAYENVKKKKIELKV